MIDRFTIETSGIGLHKRRLIASAVLGKSDFDRIASKLGSSPIRARKTGLVAARKVQRRETVDTYWNGKETSNVAAPGDFVVTSLADDGNILRDRNGMANVYVIKADGFAKLYAPVPGGNEFGAFHKAKREVTAVYFSGGFDIMAPWGERERAPEGYLVFNGDEVYGNNAETFAASYEILTT